MSDDPWNTRKVEEQPDLDEAIKNLQKQLAGIFNDRKPTPAHKTPEFWFGVLQVGFGILVGIGIGAIIWAG